MEKKESHTNSTQFSSKNIDIFLKKLTQSPHPMGSPEQEKMAVELQKQFSHIGLKTSLERFVSATPNLKNELKKLEMKKGINIVARLQGVSKCAVIFSGHYDTKYFPNQYFIGANDGGSSTAFLLELARVYKETQFHKKSLGSCTAYFVLFDGEESFLENWNDGKEKLDRQDNLYGSRFFSTHSLNLKNNFPSINGNKIELLVVFDMIGHKNQNLFLTKGSNLYYGEQLIHACKKTKIQSSDIYIEDDHEPFLKLKLPILHIIDWTNLNEWHTEKDNLDIISSQKIKQFGDEFIQFLKTTPFSNELNHIPQ